MIELELRGEGDENYVGSLNFRSGVSGIYEGERCIETRRVGKGIDARWGKKTPRIMLGSPDKQVFT